MRRSMRVGIVPLAVAVWLGGLEGCHRTPESHPGNVILFLGDGLGPSQVTLGLNVARELEGRKLHMQVLMERGMTGYALAVTEDNVVIDSAASATQIATGLATRSEMLGVDADGHPEETILEWAEDQGLATGLVSNMSLTHATPAAFASHQTSRYADEAEIATDIAAQHEIEVLLGGGARAFVARGRRVSDELAGVAAALDDASNRKDDRSLVAESRARGYTVASDVTSLQKGAREATKLLGLFSASHLPYELDRRADGLESVPRLGELTESALEVLARNESGFFLMVEGGRIDYAAHDNDAGCMLHEILEFDRAIGVGLRFQEKHPNTLVVVTADHGTGGFSFTYSLNGATGEQNLPPGINPTRWYYPGRKELEILARQTSSYERILARVGGDVNRLIEEVRKETGLVLTPDEAAPVLVRNRQGRAEPHDFRHFYADYENTPECLLARALSRQTSVVWSTGGHTSEPILTFGSGPGAEGLRGVYPNWHIHGVMKQQLER